MKRNKTTCLKMTCLLTLVVFFHLFINLPGPKDQEKKKKSLGIGDILKNIHKANKDQLIRNEEMLGPVNIPSNVIVVQVHNRVKYLRHLITSLSMVKGIEKTLLVFSHDVWDEDINSLVRSVDFAPSLQIFYPFSLQTHPNTFPGWEKNDCPRNVKPAEAKQLKCTNADWPDIYGHYREAKFTQIKHHWWWKANHVFHYLEIIKNYEGNVLFLEEDHYVAEDFLHVLELMRGEQKTNLLGKVDILTLGTHLEQKAFEINYENNAVKTFKVGGNMKAEVTHWISNMGMAFTREVWDKITQCSSMFCQYDDYNWDWSLQQLSLNCLKEKLQVMVVRAPRVFHIGECGVHHKKSDCDSDIFVERVKSILKTAKKYLFPEKLIVSQSSLKKKIKLGKGNGGWGDKRDHTFCLNMTVKL